MLPSVLKRRKENMILDKSLEKWKRIERSLSRKVSTPKITSPLKVKVVDHHMRINIMKSQKNLFSWP